LTDKPKRIRRHPRREEIIAAGHASERHPYLDMPTIAKLCGVRSVTPHVWRYRGVMPDHDIVVAGRPMWQLDRILWWITETNRWPQTRAEAAA
jgi:hypothetical protein